MKEGAAYHSIYDFIIVSVLTIALTFHATFFCAYLLLIPTIDGKNDANQMHLRQRTEKEEKKKYAVITHIFLQIQSGLESECEKGWW